jgi:lipopolysaccharide export LptBFGC system permease protein LptF
MNSWDSFLIPTEPWMVWTGIIVLVAFFIGTMLIPYSQDAWKDLKERLKELNDTRR